MNIQSVYSPSENAIYLSILYDDYVKAGTWPKDGIAISDEDAEKFNGGNKPAGKILGVVDGALAWIDEPPRTAEQQKSDALNMKTTLRAKADAEISWRQDAVDAEIATTEEAAALAEWKKYRIMLMRIDTDTEPDITWPEPPQ